MYRVVFIMADVVWCLQGLSLEPSAEVKNLEYIMAALAIPAAPRLAPISETHTPVSLKSDFGGQLWLHQHLLQEVKKKLKCSEKLTPLLADLRDLSAQVHKQEAQLTPSEPQAQSSSLSSRLTGDYEVQVATHLVLQQLRSFGQDVFRSLRHIFTQSALGA
uniref:Uncharacterized protein n=1 Tax=Pygocentrus nattereri TaxID=42514 RepID=A0A3B4DBC7_PYGNA